MRVAYMKSAVAICLAILGIGTNRTFAGESAAEATVVGVLRNFARFELRVLIAGKAVIQDVFAFELVLDDKTHLVGIMPVSKLEGDTPQQQNKKAMELERMQISGELKFVAIKGRLVRENEKVRTGIRFLGKEVLTFKDKKQLVLDGSSLILLDKQNKNRYPATGKAWIQGKQVCGKEALKLFEEPTLAIQNGQLPIILEGEKSRAKAGNSQLRVTGSIRIDDRGLVRITSDEVKEVGK